MVFLEEPRDCRYWLKHNTTIDYHDLPIDK